MHNVLYVYYPSSHSSCQFHWCPLRHSCRQLERCDVMHLARFSSERYDSLLRIQTIESPVNLSLGNPTITQDCDDILPSCLIGHCVESASEESASGKKGRQPSASLPPPCFDLHLKILRSCLTPDLSTVISRPSSSLVSFLVFLCLITPGARTFALFLHHPLSLLLQSCLQRSKKRSH